MKQSAVLTKRASTSREEITFLQQRLAFIRELEQILKQQSAKLRAAKAESLLDGIQGDRVNQQAPRSIDPIEQSSAECELCFRTAIVCPLPDQVS